MNFIFKYNLFIHPQDTVKNNYKSIKFFPTQFEEYLMSNNVGFVHCNHIADIRLPHKTKGLRQLFLLFFY